MKYLELDIEKIKRVSKEKEQENFDFRTYLKRLDSDKVDEFVNKLNDVVVAQIDCQECGNCCKSLYPSVTDSEIETLSKLDGISKNDFILQFVEKGDFDDVKYLKDTPCKYLKDKSCQIYDSRPKVCKSYPHTQKKDFTSRTFGMIKNYEICPIVFNVYELLKQELRYNY